MRSKTYNHPCLLGCASSLRGRPSIVASMSNDADELSWSHRPWCTCWKCHLRTPVFRSTATMLSANRLLPGRLPPYSSIVGVSTGRYTRPASGSTEICVQTPTLPLHSHDPFSQVSLPNSPGPGIVLNFQSCLPVRTSNARTRPLEFVL